MTKTLVTKYDKAKAPREVFEGSFFSDGEKACLSLENAKQGDYVKVVLNGEYIVQIDKAAKPGDFVYASASGVTGFETPEFLGSVARIFSEDEKTVSFVLNG